MLDEEDDDEDEGGGFIDTMMRKGQRLEVNRFLRRIPNAGRTCKENAEPLTRNEIRRRMLGAGFSVISARRAAPLPRLRSVAENPVPV